MRMLRLVILVALLFATVFAFVPTEKAAAQTGCARTHVVQAGQNLFRIGLLYNVSWTVLAQWNGIVNPNYVYAGQVLCVSGPVVPGTGGPYVPPATGGPITIYPGNPFGPTTEPRIYFPSVTLGQKFELRGYNFPRNTQITIGLTTLGGTAYTPYFTATTDATGQFYVTVTLPAAFVSAGSVAVEARTASGYYGRNWYYNR